MDLTNTPFPFCISLLQQLSFTAQYCQQTGAHPHQDLDCRHRYLHLRAGPQTRRVIAGVTTGGDSGLSDGAGEDPCEDVLGKLGYRTVKHDQ